MKFVNAGVHSWGCIGEGDDVLHSYGANQGFVTSGDTCLVIDSGFHYMTANQILRRVQKTRPERLLLLDTHYHSDHVFGNAVYSNRGAPVLAHGNCRRKMLAL